MSIQETCPLCSKERPARKFKRLYLTPVCHKCYYGFANRRQIAYLIDIVLWRFVLFGFFIMVGVMLAAVTPNADFAKLEPWLNISAWLMALVYILKDGFKGCSPGKAICGVRVVDSETYEPIGFGRSFKRNLVLVIPIVPLIVAFMLCKGRRWGDGWAETKVIWSKYQYHPVFNADTYCPQCQYDLRANTSGACPECGRPIDGRTQRALAEIDRQGSAVSRQAGV